MPTEIIFKNLPLSWAPQSADRKTQLKSGEQAGRDRNPACNLNFFGQCPAQLWNLSFKFWQPLLLRKRPPPQKKKMFFSSLILHYNCSWHQLVLTMWWPASHTRWRSPRPTPSPTRTIIPIPSTPTLPSSGDFPGLNCSQHFMHSPNVGTYR